MNPALWIAKTGLDAQQTRMAVTANNLANVNTTGFKQSRAEFQDLMYQSVRTTGAQTSESTQLPSGLNVGTGVRTVATRAVHTQGNLSQTGGALDVAIDGRGFFQILRPDGTLAYTRDGSFQLNSEGQLVTHAGYELDPAIAVPPGADGLTIGRDGTVSVRLDGDPSPTVIGALQLADFVNPSGLLPIGDNLYQETAASGAPQVGTPDLVGLGGTVQGALETSNVNTVEEMVRMIETQRAYEMSSKAISAADQMLQTLNREL